MLDTIHQMKHTRICIVRRDDTKDRKLDVIGTTLHYVPESRFIDEANKVRISDEIQAMADYYTRSAKKIVEPSPQDVLDAAKNYIVCRRLMAAEDCHGFSMDCLGPVGRRKIKPPCLAFSRLRDEGGLGTCEADWNAAISTRLTNLLFDRPGFMQDPAPNTANNTLNGAHCTCATKLDGFDKPAAPFILRSHSESNIGVAMQVLWRIGQEVTVMKFEGPEKIILGTGRVLRNIDTPPSGGCRTSVELEMNDMADTRDTKGFHQLFIYGNLENEFKAYCQLAGIKVEHI
jgi:L-fucose isomerase-like protein